MVDETSRTELGKGEESRALEIRLPPSYVVRSRHIGHQWQTREIVSRKKPFSCEVAVSIEVAREGARSLLKKVKLIDCLRMATLSSAFFELRRGVVVHRPSCSVALLLGCHEEMTPPVKCIIKVFQHLLHDLGSVCITPLVPRSKLGREFLLYEIQYAPNADE